MSFSLTNGPLAAFLLRAGAALLSVGLLSGCIADTAEDTDLPWASNKSWEGIAPIAPTLMDRYE